MSSLLGWAAACGLGLGLGLWLLAARVTRLGRPRLADRVAPYLVDVSAAARERVTRASADPLPLVGMLLAPVLTRVRPLFDSLGGAGATATRLRQSGSELTVDQHRLHQLLGAAAGGIGGAGLVILPSPARENPVAGLGLAVLLAAVGALLPGRLLARAARRRVARIAEELPTTLEFLALSLAAGEGVHDAFRRVARIGRGELAREIDGVLAETGSGVPFADALGRLAGELRLPALERVAGQVIAALERGSPLAEVLRAQAQDARDARKRELLEVAGRKEIAMLVPLVFLILPVTVLFAVYPGIAVLRLVP